MVAIAAIMKKVLLIYWVFSDLFYSTLTNCYFFFSFIVRAGTGGDEAGIWAGDLVGTYLYFVLPLIRFCMQ